MSRSTRVLVYGDVDLNLLDGSAIWAQSMVDVVASVPDVEVSILLKAPVRTDRLLRPLEGRDRIEIVRPFEDELLPGLTNAMSPNQAGRAAMLLDSRAPFDAIVVRGSRVAEHFANLEQLSGRLWTYLTDIPQSGVDLDGPALRRLETIAAGSARILCQTEELRTFLDHAVPAAADRTELWLPVVPDPPPGPRAPAAWVDGSVRLVYSGKMAKAWRTEEMLRLPGLLRERHGLDAELHVVGDKIHDEVSDPGFASRMRDGLSGPDVVWHGGVPRDEAMRLAAACHYGLSWRSPALDDSLELSTKVLEFATLGVLPVLNRTPAHGDLLGADYPLLVSSEDEVVDAVAAVAESPELRANADERLVGVADGYSRAAAIDRMSRLVAGLRPRVSPIIGSRQLKVLVASHDLKFMDRLMAEMGGTSGIEIRVDEWTALAEHDESQSRSKLQWADVVVCEWCGPNAIWYSRNKRDGQRLIVRLHRFELHAGYADKVVAEAVDQLVTVDPHYQALARDRLGKWPRDRIVTIPNWVDTDRLSRPKLDGARFNLGMIGIAPKRKRLDLALDVLSGVRATDPRFSLFVKTKMPWDYWWIWKDETEQSHYRDQLRRIQVDPTLEGSVVFDPFGPDVGAWLRKIGTVLSTSDDESFHLSPAEGMASGAPSIVFGWPGADEVYGDPWVVDGVDDAVGRILEQSDVATWTKRSEMARNRVKPYDLADVVEAWTSILVTDRDPATWT